MNLILYHGSKQTEITQMSSGLSWSGDKSRAARMLGFDLLKNALDPNLPAVDCVNGDHVEMLDDDGKSRFFGMVVSRGATTTSPTMSVMAYDNGIYLSNNDGTYKFTQTPESAVRQICSDYGIPFTSAAATGVTVRRKFAGVPLWQIIATMYAKAGEVNGKRYMARFVGRNLEVVERQTKATNLVIRPGSNLFSASTTDSITGMRNSVAIFDSDGNRLRVIDDTDARNLYGVMQHHITQRDGEDATSEAKAYLEDNGESKTVKVTAAGDFNVITGETVIVRQPDTGLQGIFWVDADAHTWENGLHKMTLSLNMKNVAYTAEAGSELE